MKNDVGKLFAYERVVPVKTGGVAILPVFNDETGIESAKLTHLGQLNPDTGLTSDQVDLFVAEIRELNLSLANKEETETISRVRLVPLGELKQLIADNEIRIALL